jgi:hypothetical protein
VIELHAFKSNRGKPLRACNLTPFAINVSDYSEQQTELSRTEGGQSFSVSRQKLFRVNLV